MSKAHFTGIKPIPQSQAGLNINKIIDKNYNEIIQVGKLSDNYVKEIGYKTPDEYRNLTKREQYQLENHTSLTKITVIIHKDGNTLNITKQYNCSNCIPKADEHLVVVLEEYAA